MFSDPIRGIFILWMDASFGIEEVVEGSFSISVKFLPVNEFGFWHRCGGHLKRRLGVH